MKKITRAFFRSVNSVTRTCRGQYHQHRVDSNGRIAFACNGRIRAAGWRQNSEYVGNFAVCKPGGEGVVSYAERLEIWGLERETETARICGVSAVVNFLSVHQHLQELIKSPGVVRDTFHNQELVFAAVLFAEITTHKASRDGIYEVPEETMLRETILNKKQYLEGMKSLKRANIVFTKCNAEGKNIIYMILE